MSVIPTLRRLFGRASRPAYPGSRRGIIVIDTDIGDDIDDAFALAWALASPTVDVAAVTTTFGNTILRAQLVRRLLDDAGRGDIPVGAGPVTPSDAIFTQAAWANAAPSLAVDDGVALLLDTISRHPEDVTLVALGPLTTVRAAIARDGVTFRRLRRVVMMGGSIRRGYNDGAGNPNPQPHAEHNVAHDVAGFRALLASGVPITLMPLDSTQARPAPEDLAALLAGHEPLAALTAQWIAGNAFGLQRPTLYDVIAMAAAIVPDRCELTPLRVEVTDDGLTIETAASPNLHACLTVDADAILRRALADIASSRA